MEKVWSAPAVSILDTLPVRQCGPGIIGGLWGWIDEVIKQSGMLHLPYYLQSPTCKNEKMVWSV